MQTQQINATMGNMFFASGGSMASVEKKTGNCFENLFRSSSEKYETITVNDKNTKASKMPHAKETVTTSDVQGKTEGLEEGTGKAFGMNGSNKAEENEEMLKTESEVVNSKAVDGIKNGLQDKDVNETELAENVAMLLMQTMEIVKETLKLTEEQLNGAMELLGITKEDLLNTDVLKQLVLNVNGEQNPAAFLMNGDLFSQMNELTQAVEHLMEEGGVSTEEWMALISDAEFAEQLKAAIEKLMSKAEAENVVSVEEPEQETLQKEQEISFKPEEDVQDKPVMYSKGANEKDMGNENFRQENDNLAGQFVQNLEKAFTEGVQETSLRSDLAAQIREIADQILEQVKMLVTPETTSLEIQLTPEQLGKVNVTVTEQDGVLKASFVTENELTKEAIESNLVQFKQMMNEQGIHVEAIEVTVSEFAFDKNSQAGQNNQEEQKNHKTRFVTEQETDSVTMQDELALHFMEGGESTVNYMA